MQFYCEVEVGQQDCACAGEETVVLVLCLIK